MEQPDHFSDAKASCWQSAVAHVAAKDRTDAPTIPGTEMPAPRDRNDPLVLAATRAADAHSQGVGAPTLLQSIEDCAKGAFQLGLADLFGDTEKARELKAQFDQYGKCDGRWAECVEQFKAYYRTATTKKAYRPWGSLSDFVIDLPSRCKIGIIGDWGTGQARAAGLLRNLAKHEPDFVIHLGDIYYSCTEPEADLFFDAFRDAFPVKKPRVFSLCGNHDMYSGGVAYQGLIARLDQPASFFCLRNRDWQILAGDSGFNDFDPSNEGSIASWIQDRDGGIEYSELDWHKDKFLSANGRRTILLTHHQPFTSSTPIEGGALNPKLLAQFAPFSPTIALWLWGHEHNQVLYSPFQGVQKGRCLGASGMPTSPVDNPYTPSPQLVGQDLPTLLPGARLLQVDDNLGLYNLGYAILEIVQEKATATYLDYNSTSNSSAVSYNESL